MKRCEVCGFFLTPPEENELFYQKAITGIKLSAICDSCKDDMDVDEFDDNEELTFNPQPND